MKNNILAINGGSSSIKFALYKIEDDLAPLFQGKIDGIGLGKDTGNINFNNNITNKKYAITVKIADHNAAADFLVDWLEKQEGYNSIQAIGHRIVHGMQNKEPLVIDTELMNQLSDISTYDPEHLPGEIKLVEVFGRRYPEIAQIACFDTSFHASMPHIAKLLSIPRRYYAMGIQRYGFHGLSYAFLLDELKRDAGDTTAQGRIILAHLGNGASLAAIKEGKSVDTTMGFTPSSGLPMGTRTGDLDPGVALYLMKTESLSPEQFNTIINHESGLLGVSETSSDIRDLLDIESTDSRAADATELFCYQTRKAVGSFTAVLGGLDTLVFSGGIGENSPEIRDRICRNLQFLGIELDESKNFKNEAIISKDTSKVSVRVIKTNEELMIAKLVRQFLDQSTKE